VQCDRPIPGLEPHLDSGGPVDLSIHLSARPDWAESDSTETYGRAEPGDEAPLLRLREYAGDRVLLHYSDDTRFYLDAPRGEVWATWPDTLTLEDTATYLLGPVVGHFLRRRGELCLHGSAVLLGGRCVVFAGPAGAGKSTLAAAMATLGRRILTEDVCCLARDGEAFRVQPGYPRIRLWPDAAALIGVPQAELPPLTPNWDKRFMPLAEGARAFHDRPEPLAAVFVLTPRDDMTEAARLRELGGHLWRAPARPRPARDGIRAARRARASRDGARTDPERRGQPPARSVRVDRAPCLRLSRATPSTACAATAR
jgi:hypothetical protein